jgi:hypothetical protein
VRLKKGLVCPPGKASVSCHLFSATRLVATEDAAKLRNVAISRNLIQSNFIIDYLLNVQKLKVGGWPGLIFLFYLIHTFYYVKMVH